MQNVHDMQRVVYFPSKKILDILYLVPLPSLALMPFSLPTHARDYGEGENAQLLHG